MQYTGKYAEAKDGWDRIGPLAFFHREKDEVSFFVLKIHILWHETFFHDEHKIDQTALCSLPYFISPGHRGGVGSVPAVSQVASF